MIAEHKHLAGQGVKLVELRLDFINGPIKFKRLLAKRPCPAIITFRREQDGGRWEEDEETRIMALRTAIVEGADYVDLEEDIADKIPRYGDTKRIISYHNFRETPADLEELYYRMSKLDPDIIKIATMANSPMDNVRILKMVEEAKIPTIGLCMGEMGMPSRVLGGKYGVPFTYATFSNERTLAPGQIGYRQMQEIYGYDQINQETEIYGVIADPIGHSLSPHLHNAGFQHIGANKRYLPFRVPREHLAHFVDVVCPKLGIKGLSVTIPHKEEVLETLKKPSEAVKGIGACNTVVFDEAGSTGYNTDCQAILESLATAFPSQHDGNLRGKKVLILGSGGVAKAIAWGMKSREADVTISGRNKEKADLLAENLDCSSIAWERRGTVKPDILFNGTPVGMHPNVDESPFFENDIHRTMIVFDTVYNPEQTLLLKQAKAKGCKVVTGVEMFVRQAALQFEKFAQEPAPRELMRDVLKKTIGAARTN